MGPCYDAYIAYIYVCIISVDVLLSRMERIDMYLCNILCLMLQMFIISTFQANHEVLSTILYTELVTVTILSLLCYILFTHNVSLQCKSNHSGQLSFTVKNEKL